MSVSRWCLCAPVLVSCLIVPSCGDDPSGPGGIAPDSAWMAVERLRTAYEEMDVDLFRDCLDGDFEYHCYDFEISEWLHWGLWYEELCHDSLLCVDHVDHIELTFAGDTDLPWSGAVGDTTIRELPRTFDLNVYTGPGMGYHAQGTVVFVCRPDSPGFYRIWQWTDQSDFKNALESVTWPDLKRELL